jgi:hypothetical protein
MNVPPIFSFFYSGGKLKIRRAKKKLEKQADHGLTVRLPVAIKKGGHYGP